MYKRTLLAIALLSILLLPAFLSCTDRIDIRTRTGEEHLIIYGYITNQPEYQKITITRSSPFYATLPPAGVSGAQVMVSSSEGNTYTFTETADADGTYLSDIEFAGTPDMEYTLNVEVDFDGDGFTEHFTASDPMPFPARGDRIKLVWSRFLKNTVNIVVWGELPQEQTSYFLMKIKVGEKIVNDSLSKFFLLNEEFIETKILDSLTIYMLDQKEACNKIETGDEVSLIAIFMTKGYHDFLLYAMREINPSPPLFDGPPANASTNIRQSAGNTKIPFLGYFSAYAQESVSTIATEEFMNTPHK